MYMRTYMHTYIHTTHVNTSIHTSLRIRGLASPNESDSGGAFGPVPHQIRGQLGIFSTTHASASSFSKCTACSPAVCKIMCYKHNLKFIIIYRLCRCIAMSTRKLRCFSMLSAMLSTSRMWLVRDLRGHTCERLSPSLLCGSNHVNCLCPIYAWRVCVIIKHYDYVYVGLWTLPCLHHILRFNPKLFLI